VLIMDAGCGRPVRLETVMERFGMA